MLGLIKKQRFAQVLFGFFLLLSAWWVWLRVSTTPEDINNQIFAALYGTMALVGAVGGFIAAGKWGLKSLMGKALFFFSLGLFAQEFGQLSYSFYIYFLQIDVPYPSLGDLGFFGSIPLYICGVILLSKASGVNVSLKSFRNQIQAVVLPIVILLSSYLMFMRGYEFDLTQPIIVFLDFGYPFGQAIYVSLAFLTYLLSRKVLGGVMKNKIFFIVLALIVQYLADYMFLYQAKNGGWYAGGLNDYVYLVSYFMMALGLLQLRLSHVREQLQKN